MRRACEPRGAVQPSWSAWGRLRGQTDRRLHRDLKTLAEFIGTYCDGCHRSEGKQRVDLKSHDVDALMGRPLVLCPSCTKLLAHAFVKRTCCPRNPKPGCKHCSTHCYHPTYRKAIRTVMKYSGRKLILTGRVHYLWHLLA